MHEHKMNDIFGIVTYGYLHWKLSAFQKHGVMKARRTTLAFDAQIPKGIHSYRGWKKARDNQFPSSLFTALPARVHLLCWWISCIVGFCRFVCSFWWCLCSRILTRIHKQGLLPLFYGDAEAGDGKPDGDSGADGDAYYHYVPVLSVKFGLNWFQVS